MPYDQVTKKLNHYVPKGYLRGWEKRTPIFQHFEILNIKTQKFEPPDRDRSFAAKNDLYTFYNDGKRDTSIEDFFQTGERALGLFRELVLKGKMPTLNDKFHAQLIEGIGALQYRHPYGLKITERILNQSLIAEERLAEKKAILQVMLDSIQMTKNRFHNASIVIVVFDNFDVITSDSPLFDLSNSRFKEDMMYFPVTSNAIALIGKSKAMASLGIRTYKKPTLMIINSRKVKADFNKLQALVNNFTIAQARQWLVCSRDHSNKGSLLAQVTRELVAKRAETDVVKLIIEGEEHVIYLEDINLDE